MILFVTHYTSSQMDGMLRASVKWYS